MGAKPSCPLPPDEIESIRSETGLTETAVADLWDRFRELDRHGRGTLGREDFLAIPDFMRNPLADRITHLFFPARGEGKGSVGSLGSVGSSVTEAEAEQRVDFRQFVRTLAIFRPLSEKELRDSEDGKDFVNSKKEKLRFSFRMYDIDGNGEIQETEILEVLQMMLDLNIDPQHLVNIAKRTLAEADKDGDAMITFEEFFRTLQHTDIDKSLSLRYFM